MPTRHPVTEADLPALCALPRTPEELFYCFPRADAPLTEAQLRASIAQPRADSTVVELDGRVVVFANFHQWAEGGACA